MSIRSLHRLGMLCAPGRDSAAGRSGVCRKGGSVMCSGQRTSNETARDARVWDGSRRANRPRYASRGGREPSVHQRTIGLRLAPASVEGSTAAIARGFDALRYWCGAGGACSPRAAPVVWDPTRRITSETAGALEPRSGPCEGRG
jgi:hypothetical protein